MTHQEFEALAKTFVTEERFNEEINSLYMAAGDNIDKQTFCEEWEMIKSSKVVAGLHNEVRTLNNRVAGLQADCRGIDRLLHNMAYDIILEGVKTKNKELFNIAELHIGKRAVVRYKLENGIALTSDDAEWVLKTLDE